MSEVEADEIISYVDINGDGKIDYEEFLSMMDEVEVEVEVEDYNESEGYEN